MQAEEILELLPSIQYAMLCYAFGKLNKFISYGNKGPHDSYYECYFDAIGAAADIFEVHYCERYGEHNLYVSFESMMEYLGTTPNILRGLIFCADCKRPLVRYKSVTNKGTNRYYVWICQSHSNDPASCPKKYLHETELIGILWDILRREIALASEMEAAVRRYSKSQAAQRREHELEHEEADARQALDRASMFYESLYANYVAELLTEQEYGEMKQQYRGEIARAKERLEAIEQQRKALDTQTVGNPWMKSFSRFREATELTGDMAHALIERVEVNAENGIEVKLRYRNEYRELLLAVTEAVPA